MKNTYKVLDAVQIICYVFFILFTFILAYTEFIPSVTWLVVWVFTIVVCVMAGVKQNKLQAG